MDAIEPYKGRRLTGKLLVPWSEASKYNLAPGRIVFADYAFLKIADPQVVSMHIQAWPFKVIKTEPDEGGIKTTLDYMNPEPGSRAVAKFAGLPNDRRPRMIDEVHAGEKWKAKSPY